MKTIQDPKSTIISTTTRSVLLLAGAAAIAASSIANAAVISVPGNTRNPANRPLQDLNAIVGAGNSGVLQGDFWIYYDKNGGSFSVPIDTNGHTLNLDTGGGNFGHVASGAISGSGSVIIKHGPNGTGFWNSIYTISGSTANTYTGTTTLLQGSLLLNKTAGVDALLGSITVGDGAQAARIAWGADNQVNDLASFTLRLPTTSGGNPADAYLSFLDLAGFSDAIGSLTLADGGARTQVRTGAGGVLTVTNLSVNGVTMDAGTYTSGNSSFVYGSGSLLVIPEPSAILLSSLGVLALLRRRR